MVFTEKKLKKIIKEIVDLESAAWRYKILVDVGQERYRIKEEGVGYVTYGLNLNLGQRIKELENKINILEKFLEIELVTTEAKTEYKKVKHGRHTNQAKQ